MTAERTADAKRRAAGYRRRDDGRLELDSEDAIKVADAFRLRANGATVMLIDVDQRTRALARP